MRVFDPHPFLPPVAVLQDSARLPPDPIPYGPATWGPTQWLAVAAYAALFLAFLWFIARIARPLVPSETAPDESS